MIEIKNNVFVQGFASRIALCGISVVFKLIKGLLLSRNPMIRYITVYTLIIIAFLGDLFILAHAAEGWSPKLIEKPLYIAILSILAFTLFIVRKNRIDKNKFTEITHNLIEADIAKSSKQLCVKIDSIVERYVAMGYTLMPGQMLSEIADVYSNEISIRFGIIWNVLLKTIKTNTLTITTKTFSKRLNYELKNSFNILEKYFLETLYMNAKDKNLTKYLLKEKRLEFERDRLKKKYKAETTLLSNGKMFIPDHVL